jgi:hypothetical protein
VIWALLNRRGQQTRDRVYVCTPRTGGRRVVFSEGENARPRVSQFQVAGTFVGFLLTYDFTIVFRGEPDIFSATDLFVFDAARGRVTQRLLTSCTVYFDDTCGGAPEFDHFLLAPTGWVAELYDPLSYGSPPDTAALVASDGTHTIPLDFGLSLSNVSVAGDSASWAGDLSGVSSATLDARLIPAPTLQSLAPCDLLTSADLAPVMGVTTSSSFAGGCTYTGATNTLTLTLPEGLSESDLIDATPFYELDSWGTGERNFDYFHRSITISGTPHEQVVGFQSASALSLDLSASGPQAAAQLTWLANVALQRLFAVPVQRAS